MHLQNTISISYVFKEEKQKKTNGKNQLYSPNP